MSSDNRRLLRSNQDPPLRRMLYLPRVCLALLRVAEPCCVEAGMPGPAVIAIQRNRRRPCQTKGQQQEEK